MAPGSDNWAVTWGEDGEQYTTWGDGGGFGGDNLRGRVSLGVARIEGDVDSFETTNVWGGYMAESRAQFPGKSYGILAVAEVLWMWRTGDDSDGSAFKFQDLYFSTDYGRRWQSAGVEFASRDFLDDRTFFAPTFLQFGPGYADSRDDYVYIYLPEKTSRDWDVQKPGSISLMRVHRDHLADRERYEFYYGLDKQGRARWGADVNERKDVFTDSNGVMRTSVVYNADLERYILITQQVSRFKEHGHIGIYEAPEPWGPWKTVLFDSPWRLGLQKGDKTVFWNLSNKWSGNGDGHFTMIYTGPSGDNFGMIQGYFKTR